MLEGSRAPHLMSRYLTTTQIARVLGLADSTIRHYRASGRIVPRSRTPGGHARYDLDEVAEALGIDSSELAESVAAATPRITGLVTERFASLGEHDVRRSGRSRVLPAEIVALGMREISDPPQAEAANRPRWGGELVTARRRAHA